MFCKNNFDCELTQAQTITRLDPVDLHRGYAIEQAELAGVLRAIHLCPRRPGQLWYIQQVIVVGMGDEDVIGALQPTDELRLVGLQTSSPQLPEGDAGEGRDRSAGPGRYKSAQSRQCPTSGRSC